MFREHARKNQHEDDDDDDDYANGAAGGGGSGGMPNPLSLPKPDGVFHILGGCNGSHVHNLLEDMWQLDLNNWTWRRESPHNHGAWPVASFFHSTVMSRVGAVTFGGVTTVEGEDGLRREQRTSAVQVLAFEVPSLVELCLHAVAAQGPTVVAEVLEAGAHFPKHVLDGLAPT